MNWLFWVIVAFIVLNVFIGGRKGFFKTAISMVFLVLVLVLASLLNPYVSKFLREDTPVYQSVHSKCEDVLFSYLEKEAKDKISEEDKAALIAQGISEEEIEAQIKKADVPADMQKPALQTLPLPEAIRRNLIYNNRADVYELLGVNKFVDYVSSYAAYSITNGIAFLLSFTLAIIIVKVALYAINILTAIPGISFVNAVGGMLLGGVCAILWVWVFFLVVTVLCNTAVGKVLMAAIEGDILLSFLYDKNIFLPVIMSIFA